jgi:hypothetical protein
MIISKQSRRELLDKVFESMPVTFTSTEFTKAMIEAGANQKLYLYGHLAYLKNRCIRQSKKTWTKEVVSMNEYVKKNESSTYFVTNPAGTTSAQSYVTVGPNPIVGLSSSSSKLEDHISFAIKLLKENGYKIYKTTTVEV